MKIAESAEKIVKSGKGLSEIARLARVSPGTVSRVFNNSNAIPNETKLRVFSVARELGIRPRIGVRNKQIALITEPSHKTVMGGYVSTMTQHICFFLSRANADITLITEDEIGKIANSWFDGIIGIAWEEKTIELLEKVGNVPIVWLSDMYKDRFHSVYSDYADSGRLAGKYLVGHGHHRIAVIHDPDYAGHLRVEGLSECLAEAGFPSKKHLFSYPNNAPLHLSVKRLIDAGCTAVWVTGEDMKVLEVNWLIQELAGKRIPEDISLLGFENPGISEFLRPSLTTLVSPLREMAEKAVSLAMRDELGIPEQIKLPVRLIERNSVATIK